MYNLTAKMQDQSFLANNQVAFIFLLLLASANLAFANPVSSSQKVVDYNVQIRESGAQYNETIEVDTEKQTELFKVPAHNNVDHSNILHDFKANMSMLLLPEKKICYLLPLDKELTAPRKLAADLDKTEKTIKRTVIIDNKWTMGSEVTDRSVISNELANFCPDYPIYKVKKMEDTMTSTRIQTGEGKTRKRRTLLEGLNINLAVVQSQAFSYVEIESDVLCDGGKGTISASDVADCIYIQQKSWNVQCQITTESCYWITVCPTFDYCYQNHLQNTMFCCEYICS